MIIFWAKLEQEQGSTIREKIRIVMIDWKTKTNTART